MATQKTTQSFADALRARRAELQLTQSGYVNHLNKLFIDKNPELLPVISLEEFYYLEAGIANPLPYLIVLLSVIGEYMYISTQKTNQLFPDALRARRAELQLTQSGYVNHLNKLFIDKNPELLTVISVGQLRDWEEGLRRPTKFLAALLVIIGEIPF